MNKSNTIQRYCSTIFFRLSILPTNVLISLFLIVSASGLFANGDELLAFQKDLLSFSGGLEGSPQERMVFNTVADRLDHLGIQFRRLPLNTSPGHSYSEIIEAVIPGSIPDIYVLAAPIQDGEFATALLVEIARNLIVHPPLHTVKLLFLGGERGDTPYHPYGSRYIINTFGTDETVFAVYIDAKNQPAAWAFKAGGNGLTAPLGLIQSLVDAAAAESLPYQFYSPDLHVNNLGLQGNIGSYATWLEAEIPTIALWGEGKVDDKDRNRQIDSTVFTLLDIDRRVDSRNQEHIYIYSRPFKSLKPRFIGEQPFVVFVLIYFMFLLSLVSFQYRTIKLNRYRFASYWGLLPFLFLLVFFFFFLSTLLIEEIGYLKDFPTIWKYAIAVTIFFKLFTAISLSLNFILVVHGLPLPDVPHFYSNAAVLISTFLTIVFMVLDITLVPYTIWITIMLLLFMMNKHKSWKTFYLLLSMLPHAIIIFIALSHSYTEVIAFLLLSRIRGNFIASLAVFPILLAIISLHYWDPHYKGTRRNNLLSPIGLMVSLSALVSLLWLINLKPFNTNNEQPAAIVDSIDSVRQERYLEIDSPAPIGNAEIMLDEIPFEITGLGRQAKVRMPYNNNPLEIVSHSRSFLSRRSIDVEINGNKNPHRIIMEIRSPELFTLHSASLPFEMAPSGQEATIFIGDNPPFPLNLQMIVNSNAKLTLSADVIWESPEDSPVIIRDNLKVQTKRLAKIEADI